MFFRLKALNISAKCGSVGYNEYTKQPERERPYKGFQLPEGTITYTRLFVF